jgi:hypothetical protein
LETRKNPIADISVVKDLPLRWLNIEVRLVADLSPLKNHKTLREINGVPVAEFWKKYDALAARFIENFKLMMEGCPEHVLESGPKRLA